MDGDISSGSGSLTGVCGKTHGKETMCFLSQVTGVDRVAGMRLVIPITELLKTTSTFEVRLYEFDH